MTQRKEIKERKRKKGNKRTVVGNSDGGGTGERGTGNSCRIKLVKEIGLQLQPLLLKITSNEFPRTPFKVQSFPLSMTNVSIVALLEERLETISFSY